MASGRLYNLAKMNTATSGTGTITLSTAVSGFLSFADADVANGEVVTYIIEEGANRELGYGTYTSSGTTLTRNVLKSTNADAAISLSGAAQVGITAARENFIEWFADIDANGFSLGMDDNTGINDDSGNEVVRFRKTTSAVNYVEIKNTETTVGPSIGSVGDDTNINLNLTAKGSGVVTADGVEVVTLTGTQTLTNKTLTSPTLGTSPTAAGATWPNLGTVTTADINGGTIDGAVIGGASAAAITGTTITANTGFMPDANDGAYIGQSGTAFSDLFLASGGVINFNAGDVTITHASNVLAIQGGNVAIGGASAPELLSLSSSGTTEMQLNSTGGAAFLHFAASDTNIIQIGYAGSNTYWDYAGVQYFRSGVSGPTRAELAAGGTWRWNAYGAGTLTTDASGNITATSDERLKTNITPWTRGLSDVLKINPILYNWTPESGLDQLNAYAGYSAQNMETAIPEAIGVGSNGYMGIDLRPISAAHTNAIKTLIDKIEALEARIAALEAA